MAATTVTFGGQVENHAGMERKGAMEDEGLALGDLVGARRRFEDAGYACELVHLIGAARVEELEPEPAYVLVVRGGAGAFGPSADELSDEQDGLEKDTKAFMRGRVVNKLARHNLCFTDEGQEPDYEAGKGRIIAFADIPRLAAVREGLPRFFGGKAAGLLAEGNYYYDVRKCGIGFHGDSERRIVIALRFGASIPLHYQWFLRGRPVGLRVALTLNHGDLYAMSEKAAGTDWRRTVVPTLRHAAGARRYLTIEGHPPVFAPTPDPTPAVPAKFEDASEADPEDASEADLEAAFADLEAAFYGR